MAPTLDSERYRLPLFVSVLIGMVVPDGRAAVRPVTCGSDRVRRVPLGGVSVPTVSTALIHDRGANAS